MLDNFFSVLSCVVSVPFYTGFLPLLFWSGHGRLAGQMTLLMAFCDYLSNSVKDMVSAPRPCSSPIRRVTATEDERENAMEYGLPSSHALNTVCLTGYLLHYVLTYGEHGSLIVAAGLSLALYSKFASCPAKQSKDVVKALKKRIGHKNPKVQLLALTEDGWTAHPHPCKRVAPYREALLLAEKHQNLETNSDMSAAVVADAPPQQEMVAANRMGQPQTILEEVPREENGTISAANYAGNGSINDDDATLYQGGDVLPNRSASIFENDLASTGKAMQQLLRVLGFQIGTTRT
ncbi:uncharacterized protein [Zea mays]|nr:uncharacterized protein LOC103629566 [Zea mays]|eukprot:XP_020394890.1 uncharacterized protein LOC103629566 [Zea mays]